MKQRVESFLNALTGIKRAYLGGRNMQICWYAFLLLIYISYTLKLEAGEWGLLMICCGAVLAAEVFNTAIERACDGITEDRKEFIRDAKDMSAGAVLILSFFSAVVGSFVLFDYLGLILDRWAEITAITLAYIFVTYMLTRKKKYNI